MKFSCLCWLNPLKKWSTGHHFWQPPSAGKRRQAWFTNVSERMATPLGIEFGYTSNGGRANQGHGGTGDPMEAACDLSRSEGYISLRFLKSRWSRARFMMIYGVCQSVIAQIWMKLDAHFSVDLWTCWRLKSDSHPTYWCTSAISLHCHRYLVEFHMIHFLQARTPFWVLERTNVKHRETKNVFCCSWIPSTFRLLFCGTSVRCSGRGVDHSFGVPSCATMAAYRKMPPEGDFTVEMVRLKNGIAGLGWFGNVPVLHRFSGFDLGKWRMFYPNCAWNWNPK